MNKIPQQISNLLAELKTHTAHILKKNLVGIYLYGSLTQAAFNSKHSDIDCIVVTRRDLSATAFAGLDQWLTASAKSNPWTTQLQMLFLAKNKILTMNAKACLYQFGQLTRSSSDGNPIPWLNILKSGVVLVGVPPNTFVPKITHQMLRQALERELGYLREEICSKTKSQWRDVPKYRVYAVFTLCRILYSWKKGLIASKPKAAHWVIEHQATPFNELIGKALAYVRDESGRIALRQLKQFIDFVDTHIGQKNLSHHHAANIADSH